MLDVTEVTLKDPYWDLIQEKCPGIIIRLENATGIRQMEGKKPGSDIFSLSGQRMVRPTTGIHVAKGKKFVIK